MLGIGKYTFLKPIFFLFKDQLYLPKNKNNTLLWRVVNRLQ